MEKDAIAALDKQRADALAQKKRLIVTDDDVARFARSYRIRRANDIGSKYHDQLHVLRDACTNKAKPVIELMRKQI